MAAAMHMRESFVLTSLLVVTACPASPGTTTDPGTTDGPNASTGDPSSGGTSEPTTGTTTDSTDDTTAGTTGDPPALPETCADVLAGDPGAADGEYTLYIGKDADKPWPAYCNDMAGTPAEYLVLVNVEDGRNFSQYTNADPEGADLRTAFTRVRIDPKTLVVDIDDLTFSTSTGEVNHGGPVTTMPYAVAEGCSTEVDGVANIDLVGTPFKVIDPFCTTGADADGGVVFSSNDQVVDLTGGGYCGWTGPTRGDGCVDNPQNKSSGFVLELAYIDDSSPLIAETCAAVKAAMPDATDGEYTLYVAGDESRPWTAYCKDMATAPIEYLPLVNVEDGRNFSQYTNADPEGADLRTAFTRVRIDPKTLVVDIDDLTFSTSTGEVNHGGPVTTMPYAVAEGCSTEVDGVANIDLVGTPFKVIDPFCTTGADADGGVVFSSNDQVVDLTGGGYCGWTGPTRGDGCVDNPQNKSSGFVLELAYIDP
jgi:hypothetical protein